MMSGDGLSSSSFLHDTITNPNPTSANSAKRKRNLPGNPDPDAEIIALSPKSLMATNRFVCEICNKGFQRDQNLQLHRRGHNLPWKLKQRNKQEVVKKKVYICPETSCVHHDPSRALGDLTGVKKHFSRKHGEKKWKCEKCTKKYAVQSDWKAHSKICGTREYKCDCGTLFCRKDSFITHRAFCDPLKEEHSRMASFAVAPTTANLNFNDPMMMMMMSAGGGRIMNPGVKPMLPIWLQHNDNNPMENSTTSSSFLGSSSSNNNNGGMLSSEMVQWLNRNHETVDNNFTGLQQGFCLKEEEGNTIGEIQLNPMYGNYGGGGGPTPPLLPPHMSATALLQKASQIGSAGSIHSGGFGLVNMSDQPSAFGSLNQSEGVGGGMVNGGRMMMSMMAGLAEKTGGGGGDSGDGDLTRDFLGVEGLKFSCWMNDSSVGFSGNQ